MKRFISILLAAVLLLTTVIGLCSCGEKMECEGCGKEFNKAQAKTKVYDGYTYKLCKDCADLIQDYVDGKAVECPYCGNLVRKKDAHVNSMFGETEYMCDECWEEWKDFFG